ncbi:hypothetical protein BN1051_00752 [Arthrobacter saudimassiliensis]|uniref:5-bromo-4-chloroindolyl phosphate hydrolysis protein n=1 Tax=Arthrobacter saudimassiliensis TaxID=1461584 RepID=A0A078MJ82_9MICC|nr:hypothetical protein BN1051_00752 [Arthrobacter saudimassiliensis]
MLKRFAVRAAAAAVALAALVAGLAASFCYLAFFFLQSALAELADVGGEEPELSLGVLLGLFMGPSLLVGGLVAAFIGARRSRRALLSRRGRKLDAAARARAWRMLYARRDELMVRWSRYETDVALMIDYPVMTDYSEPVIREVLKSMQAIRAAEAEADEGRDPARSSLRAAVDRFEVAFLAAERHARRLGQSKLTPQERSRLSAARSALNIILDAAAPPSEVEAAYRSLRSSLRGILDLPPQVMAGLEARARPVRPLAQPQAAPLS